MRIYLNIITLLVLLTKLSVADETDVTVGLIGDSTVATQYGWGPAFTKLIGDRVTVLNHAKNGATLDSRSKALDMLLQAKPNYILIQFGHKDMKRYDTTAYSQKLTDYVERIKRADSQAIVLSSVTRRNFDENGEIRPSEFSGRTLPEYARAAQAVAKQQAVPFIDLNAISIAHHNKIGPEASAAYNFKRLDTTHFSKHGAEAITRLLISELKQIVPELAADFK